MKYNELHSMIVPFINVRGGDVVYPYEALDVSTHNAIQDMYTEYNWSWSLTSKKILKDEWTDGNGYFVYEIADLKTINSVEFYDKTTCEMIEFSEAKVLTELGRNKFMKHGNNVIVSEALDITVSYYKDYIWDLFMQDTSAEIPMPNKMIPALYYLILSQIDIIEVTQADNQTYSNYGKYENKIKTLKMNDSSISQTLIGGNRD